MCIPRFRTSFRLDPVETNRKSSQCVY